MAGRVLFGRADIDKIDALAAAARGKLIQAGNVQETDAVLGGAAVGISFGGGAAGVGHRGQPVPVGARFQLVAGQHPAGSAVFQPDDFPIQPHPLQNPRADNAARAAGAVDDHGSIGVQVGGNIGDAEGQLAAGHTAPAGNAETAVFLRRPRVQYHHFVAAFHTGAQFNGVNLRHIVDDFHLFAEIFTRNIHAPLGGMVQAHPAVDAPVQPGDVGVAHSGGSRHGAGHPPPVIIAQHNKAGGMGNGGGQVKLQHPARNQAAAGNMAGVILARLADVDQSEGNAGVAVEQFVETGRGDWLGHSATPCK